MLSPHLLALLPSRGQVPRHDAAIRVDTVDNIGQPILGNLADHPVGLFVTRRQFGDAMLSCIECGLRMEGELPGGLRVKRRAKAIHDQLQAEAGRNITQPHAINDWLSVYAMAVNEENAAGGRVVTAPTNGAAGVVPAVLH